MLRILVISLFVANLLLLAFQEDKPEVEPETKASTTVERKSDVPTIHLFSEMIEDQGLLTGNRRCFSLGPFHSIEDRDDTHARLIDVSSGISERETQALVEKGYWVFMPPYASLLIANQELLSLQALGLEDIGVIYDGEWKNAISLGYFLRQENAARRKKGLEDKGYAPLIRVQRQSESRYWLDYEQSPGSALIALDMQNRPNDFMQRSLPCPEEDLFELTETEPQLPAQATAQPQTPEIETDSNQIEDASTELEEATGPVTDQDESLATDETNEPEGDQAEDLNIEDSIENGTQEGVEVPPEPAIETEADSETETGPPER